MVQLCPKMESAMNRKISEHVELSTGHPGQIAMAFFVPDIGMNTGDGMLTDLLHCQGPFGHLVIRIQNQQGLVGLGLFVTHAKCTCNLCCVEQSFLVSRFKCQEGITGFLGPNKTFVPGQPFGETFQVGAFLNAIGRQIFNA